MIRMSNNHPKAYVGQSTCVSVRNNDVDKALRVLKKKLQREGVFKEMKSRKYYTSKGEERREDAKRSVARAFKAKVKGFQREGLSKSEAQALARTGRMPSPR